MQPYLCVHKSVGNVRTASCESASYKFANSHHLKETMHNINISYTRIAFKKASNGSFSIIMTY